MKKTFVDVDVDKMELGEISMYEYSDIQTDDDAIFNTQQVPRYESYLKNELKKWQQKLADELQNFTLDNLDNIIKCDMACNTIVWFIKNPAQYNIEEFSNGEWNIQEEIDDAIENWSEDPYWDDEEYPRIIFPNGK